MICGRLADGNFRFSLSFTVQKLLDFSRFFDFLCQTAIQSFGAGYSPEKLVSSMSPPKGTSLVNPRH
jgi:hypothetical protein